MNSCFYFFQQCTSDVCLKLRKSKRKWKMENSFTWLCSNVRWDLFILICCCFVFVIILLQSFCALAHGSSSILIFFFCFWGDKTSGTDEYVKLKWNIQNKAIADEWIAITFTHYITLKYLTSYYILKMYAQRFFYTRIPYNESIYCIFFVHQFQMNEPQKWRSMH